MTAFRRTWARPICSTILLLLATTVGNAASVTVAPTVTGSAGLFHYAYSITNNTPDDAFLIDIPVPADPFEVANVVAPTGFVGAFDSGLGLVSFLEDTSTVGTTPQSGFSFDSPDGPASVVFEATLLSNSSGEFYTISGETLAPVPEPPYALPAGLLGAGLLVFSTSRKQMEKEQNV